MKRGSSTGPFAPRACRRADVTIAPKIAGGRLATTLVEGDGFDEIAQGISLQLKRMEQKNTGELVLY